MSLQFSSFGCVWQVLASSVRMSLLMKMEMTLEEKMQRVSLIIDEALAVQKTNPVYIPAAYFSSENLGFPTPKDVFRVLRENNSIRKIEECWGYDELKKNKQAFVKTNSEKAVTDEDYKVYEIEINERKFSYKPTAKNQRLSKDDVEFDALNGGISYGKITYTFQKGRKSQLRLTLFRVLWDERQIKNAEKIRRAGMALPLETVAAKMELVDSARDFNKNIELKNKLNKLIKNVETNLQRKKLPIRLYKSGGLQIIIEV